MEFGLTEEQKLIQQTAREFAQEKLAPLAAEYDRSEEFTAPQAKMLADMGFLGMMVPEEYGGSGLDTISYVLAMEERIGPEARQALDLQNELVHAAFETLDTLLCSHVSQCSRACSNLIEAV